MSIPISNDQKFVMHDAYYVPGLKHKLISLPQIDLSGFEFYGGNGCLRVVPRGSISVNPSTQVLLESFFELISGFDASITFSLSITR